MKMTTLKSVAIAVGLASSAFGQATSPVVGFETVSVISGFNPVGLRLHESPVATGQLEAISSSSVTDNEIDFGATLAPGTYVLELENVTGVIQIVTTFSGNSLNTSEDLTSVAAPGDSYTLRPISSIETAFGADNFAGLASTTDASTSDQIWVPDGLGGFDMYFFFDNGGTPSLVQIDETSQFGIVPAEASSVSLPLDQGFLIVAAGPRDIIFSGDLKTTSTSIPFNAGFNPVSSQFPVAGQSIADIFGANNSAGLAFSTDAATSDQIWIADGLGGFDMYFFFDNSGTPTLVEIDESTEFGIVPASAEDTVISSSGYLLVGAGTGNFTHVAPLEVSNLN